MVITLSKHSNITETKNGRFSLRLRAETGTSEYVRAYMRAHDGERPPQEDIDKHARWQNLFVHSDNRDELTRLLNKLRFGKKHSLVARCTRDPMQWEGRYTDEETGEVRTALNLSTGIRYLEVWDQDIDQFVPVRALLR